MKKKLSKDILELLVNTKSIFLHASQHAQGESHNDRMIAIHGLDNSVEYLLKILIYYYDIPGINKDDTLPAIRGKIDSYLKSLKKKGIPHKRLIQDLHDIRNLVQHGQVFPSEQVERFAAQVKNFFNKVCKEHFDLVLDEIKMVELIEDSEVKDLIIKAEKCIMQEKFLEAIVNLRDAFDVAYLHEHSKFINPSYLPIALLERVGSGKKFDEFAYSLEQIEEKLEATALGVDFRKFCQYNYLLEYIPKKYRIDWTGNIVGEYKYEHVMFCYNFVIDTLLNWQTFTPIARPAPAEASHNDSKEYEFEDTFGGSKLPSIASRFGLRGIEFMTDKIIAHKDYASNEGYMNLKKRYKVGNKVKMVSKRWENGILDYHREEMVEIVGLRFRAVRHNPPIWEYYFGFKTIPNTRKIIKQMER